LHFEVALLPLGGGRRSIIKRKFVRPAADPQHHQFQNPSARTGSEGGAELLLLHYNYFIILARM